METIESVVDTTIEYRPRAVRAVRTLARTKPWQGEFDARFANIAACLTSLCQAYDLEPWQLTHVGRKSGCSGNSRVRNNLRRIELRGRLSVVTMLHLFAKVMAGIENHEYAIRWSATLFKKCFPLSFSRCRLVGGLLVNDNRRDE